MGKIKEIIDSGIPPGGKIGAGALDPGSPEVAAPRGFRQLEQKMPAREIARRAGFSIDRIKQVWGMCIVLCSCLSASAGDVSKGHTFAAGDTVTHTKLNNLVDLSTINTTFFTDKSSLAPVTADTILFYSASVGGFRKTTVGTLLLNNTDLITGQTEDTAPAGGDFFLSYDVSAAGYKKVQLGNMFTNIVMNNTNLINGQPSVSVPVLNARFPLLTSGTNAAITASNLARYVYTTPFTNLTDTSTDLLTLSNLDTVLIFSQERGATRRMALGSLLSTTTIIQSSNVGGLDRILVNNDATTKIGNMTLDQVKEWLTNDVNMARTNHLVQKFVSAEYAISTTDGGGVTNIAHGLSGTPQLVRWVFVCKTADAGYAVGDEVDAAHFTDAGTTIRAFSYGANATNTFISFTRASRINRKDGTDNFDAITEANWRAKAYCDYIP